MTADRGNVTSHLCTLVLTSHARHVGRVKSTSVLSSSLCGVLGLGRSLICSAKVYRQHTQLFPMSVDVL